MNMLASIFLGFASWLLRNERAEWARAMQSEFQHVSERERLAWALGCLIAAIRQRWAPMNAGDFRVSRLVMLVETLGCFGFLTLAWYVVTLGDGGLARMNGEIIAKNFFSYPGGPYVFWLMVASAIVWLLGPIGLILGLRYVLQGRALANTTLGWTLVAAMVGLQVFGALAGYFYGPDDFRPQPGLLLVMAVMPVAGILHLMYLGRPAGSQPLPATG